MCQSLRGVPRSPWQSSLFLSYLLILFADLFIKSPMTPLCQGEVASGCASHCEEALGRRGNLVVWATKRSSGDCASLLRFQTVIPSKALDPGTVPGMTRPFGVGSAYPSLDSRVRGNDNWGKRVCQLGRGNDKKRGNC